MADKYSVLKNYYGYDNFREAQADIIDNIMAGHDVLAVMPTGAGKSICYQIPAILLPGITLVISPLISLMKDQVNALNQNGIRAAYLNSTLTQRQYALALSNVRNGVYKIIYVAPERLMTDGFRTLASELDISMIAVDEAHCISQWGHDFRTSYTHITDFYRQLPRRPIIAAFTATATRQVKNDINELLELCKPYSVTTGFDRTNLDFSVADTKDKIGFIADYLKKNKGRSGIIYAMTRKNVGTIYRELSESGYPVTYYHAGLSDEERAANQESFIRDETPVMIATNAFGMGIDKPDVAFIIHYNMSLSMEAYYQEAGRAGRDGSDAECILLFDLADIHTAKFLVNSSTDDSESLDGTELEQLRKKRMAKLEDMINYCKCATCLRRYILRYFGEDPEYDNCGRCSSCRGDYEALDVTDIVRAVKIAVEITGERYGAVFIADYLRGVPGSRAEQLGYCDASAYGYLHDVSEGVILDVISRLLDAGLLVKCGDRYPVLGVTPALMSFLKSEKRLYIKQRAKKHTKPRPLKKPAVLTGGASLSQEDEALFEKLRKYRKAAADIRGVPPYVIFSDSVLKDIAVSHPKSLGALLAVKGIGDEKAKRYGKAVIDIVCSHDV